MIKYLLFIFIAGMLVWPAAVYADSATDAFRALKKLEARTQAGISPRDYAPALGDAKFDVNMFVQGKGAKQHPQLAAHIQRAMDCYDAVGILSGHRSPTSRGGLVLLGHPDNAVVKQVVERFPQIGQDENLGGAVSDGPNGFLDVAIAARLLWAEASKELQAAQALLQK